MRIIEQSHEVKTAGPSNYSGDNTVIGELIQSVEHTHKQQLCG
jgi:hypothetical protein